MKENLFKKIYVSLIFIFMAALFVLFFFFPSENTKENKQAATLPAIVNENGVNLNYMKELSEYFEDRFAFRNQMVDINSFIRGRILMTSSEDDVIVGKNGWLYYSSTLGDYMGDDLSSERTLFSIARNVALMQNYAENRGARFVFTICPNKNSLYPENMPVQYSRVITNDKDAIRLAGYLKSQNVNYVNLYNLYAGSEEPLYLKTDSHWNKKGAVMGYNALLNSADKVHEDYSNISSSLVDNVSAGDLSLMLYPVSTVKEPDYIYDRDYTFKYNYCDNTKVSGNIEEITKESSDTMDVTLNEIITSSDNGEGALLMYRDSFGNALIDLMSEEFGRSYFSKLEPYDLSDMDYIGADVVILEKVERHLPSLAKVAPLMSADALSEESDAGFIFEQIDANADYDANADIHKENGMLLISGEIPMDLVETDSRVFVLVSENGDASVYEAFILNENKYALYLDKEAENIDVKVYVTKKDGMTVLCDKDSLEKIKADYDRKIKEALEAKKLEEEMIAAKEKEEADRLEAERLKAEEEKRLEEERLLEEQKAEEEKAAKEASDKKSQSSGGKSIVSKTFYEDCGSDTGYYEIVWSDGTVTYEDVY